MAADQGSAVDPAVSRVKFDREIARFREQGESNLRRGWWLVDATFPKVFVVLGTPNMRPALAPYGLLIDFTGYDLVPPSVRLADPFTRKPLTTAQLGPARSFMAQPDGTLVGLYFPQVRENGGAEDGTPIVQGNDLLQTYGGDDIPFICMPGVREYHEHSAHSNDPWLPRRRSGEGTLHFLLDNLSRLGTEQMTGFGYNVQSVLLRQPPQP